MKQFIFLRNLAVFSLFFYLVSCSSTPESKLIGTWKADVVNINFDVQKASPEMIQQVAEREKQTILKFTNDTSLSIIDNNVTHRTVWKLDADQKIWYRFENDGPTMNELGTFVNGTIKTESTTALGTIEIVYKKQ